MRSDRAPIRLAVLAVAAAALVTAPVAGATDVFTTYSSMADKLPSPAPLVATWFPAARADEFVDVSGGSARGAAPYFLRVEWRKRADPSLIRAIVFLQRGRVRTLAALRRQLRGYTVRPARVRGRPALRFSRRVSPGSYLAWVEQGLVHELLTGQPRRVPLRTLQRVADNLEQLGALHVGSSPAVDDERGAGVVGFTTTRTVSLHVDVSGTCTNPDGGTAPRLSTSGRVALAPLRNGAFDMTVPSSRSGDPALPGWSIRVTGQTAGAPWPVTVDASAVVSPSAYFPAGATCATGPLSVPLMRAPVL